MSVKVEEVPTQSNQSLSISSCDCLPSFPRTSFLNKETGMFKFDSFRSVPHQTKPRQYCPPTGSFC